jgi:hypothetical protein
MKVRKDGKILLGPPLWLSFQVSRSLSLAGLMIAVELCPGSGMQFAPHAI